MTDTQKVIEWFKNVWGRTRNDKTTRDSIKDRTQHDINCQHFTFSHEDLANLGEYIWDDWRSYTSITRYHPLPTINSSLVRWNQVGNFLVKTLSIELYEFEEYDDDE